MLEIKQHPWFRKNLPRELVVGDRKCCKEIEKEQLPRQSVEEITRIVREAMIPCSCSCSLEVAYVDEIEVEVDDSSDYM